MNSPQEHEHALVLMVDNKAWFADGVPEEFHSRHLIKSTALTNNINDGCIAFWGSSFKAPRSLT